MQEQLKLLEHQQVNACTMSVVFLHQEKSDEELSTVGLAPETKNQTLNLKLSTSEKDTQTTSLSKTLGVDLTSKEKDLMPYWDQSSMEMSQKLLSLTETGSAALDLTSSNPLLVNTTANSWFVTSQSSVLKPSLYKTCFPSYTFSPAVFTVLENTLVRSKKIRIYPKMEDLNQFKRYLGLSRHWFNQAVAYLKQLETKAAALKEVRLIQKQDQPEWALDCPQRIREHAMNEACEAVKNAKLKCKKTGEYQEVHFRKKKDNTQRFGFDAWSLKDGSIFKQLLHKITFHPSEKEISELEGTKVVCEDHRWFLIIPQKRRIQRPENQRLPFVALDPGVRTFMSFYSPYVFGKIGDGDFKKIYRLCLGLDNLYSKMAVEPSKKRKFKLAAERQRWKIFDLIDDMHKKTAHFLVTRFSEIVIPTFETSQMVTKLRSKTARSMLTFAHYRFKQFLIAKAEEYSCKVIVVSEAYTSKTCSYCGCIQNIGSKKIFKCSCGVNADRDLQGARGIYLRALGALPWSEHVLTYNC